MAKKGQAVQLQAEVGSDDEWEKLLQKDGLIVVDVYSEWCGSCQGMAANLKKLKLEIGGDMLQLAIAKCDNIKDLERFRYKSEPTWMFISKGKMVGLLFGADAPKLTRLIIEELKNEQLVSSGEKIRENVMDITQMTELELTRNEAADSITRKAKEKEDAKRAKEMHEHKVEECHNILNNLHGFGVVLIFPNAREKYWEVMGDMIQEAGLTVHHTEKVNMTEEMLNELLYFNVNEEGEKETFDEYSLEDLLNDQCAILCLKPHHGTEIEDIDDVILTLVYGEHKKPPGTEDSPYQKLRHVVEDEETNEEHKVIGVWAPRVPFVIATCLKLFFHKLAGMFELAPPEPEPEHIAMIFDIHQINDAMQIMSQYPNEIMHYGFFTKEDPENTELVAKSLRKLESPENKSKRTFTEKLVIQVAKRKSECVFAFAQLEPLSMSPNAEEGARECQIFFPDDYAESLDEEDLQFDAEEIASFIEETAKTEEVPEENEATEEITEGEGATTEEEGEGEDEGDDGSDMDFFNMDADIVEIPEADLPEA